MNSQAKRTRKRKMPVSRPDIPAHVQPPRPILGREFSLDDKGRHGLKLNFKQMEEETKACMYSSLLNKLYVKVNDVALFRFSTNECIQQTVGCYLIAFILFKELKYQIENVIRCPYHLQEDSTCQLKDFVMQSHEANTTFIKCTNTNHYLNILPIACGRYFNVRFQFKCSTNCSGGINRRPVSLVFRLFKSGNIFLDQQLIDIAICTSPVRDRKNQELTYQKRQQLKYPAPEVKQTVKIKQKKTKNGQESRVCKCAKNNDKPRVVEVNTFNDLHRDGDADAHEFDFSKTLNITSKRIYKLLIVVCFNCFEEITDNFSPKVGVLASPCQVTQYTYGRKIVMSSDEDYMSDKYLAVDHKPGLMPKMFLQKHLKKEHSKLKATQVKPMKVHEAEKRDEKLNVALDESNKGFAMLSKMGFKKGMGLGKQEQGRSEPLPLQIKDGRKGLGKQAQEKSLQRKRVAARIEHAKRRKIAEESLRGDYKSRVKDRVNERQAIGDLYKSQKACHHLDSVKGLPAVHDWAWPRVKNENSESEDEADEDEPNVYTKLQLLTAHLRDVHFYCIWCGTPYKDADDLNSHCPGDTFDVHAE